ncbi:MULTISPECIES: RidA family protein [unclassified Mycolicibacterium]|uniref:RidA family protein n=1 Tax=unclassified Mycolicibacterium TaxID=2636767 RepID=UPI001F4BEB6D|nr:RidA family protein [Mycolicibacterium sp. YH-1]UNB52194.1 RidA family protein [Mycolicibacterium sp. YH-1]
MRNRSDLGEVPGLPTGWTPASPPDVTVGLNYYSAPVGQYVKVRRHNDLLFVSGHSPVRPDGTRVVGKVGPGAMTIDEAREAAELVALGLLSTIQAELGSLDSVASVLKIFGMVNSTNGFNEAPAVIDGCSLTLGRLLGERASAHARTAICVAELPFDIPVEIDAVVAVTGS